MRATLIDAVKIRSYTDKRLKEGMANAPVNRELAVLKRAFHLANQCSPPKIPQNPYIPMLKENNARKGFFERDEYLKLKAALPGYVRSILTVRMAQG